MPDNVQTLRQVNENLRAALHRLRPEQRQCGEIRPQDFSDILQETLRGAGCLEPLTRESREVTEMATETAAYRHHLEALKNLLPELHRNLLAEKARLETAQLHVATAAAWARASTGTL
jgi:hypothetical protein